MSLKESVTEGGEQREEGVSRRSLMLSLSAAPLGMLVCHRRRTRVVNSKSR